MSGYGPFTWSYGLSVLKTIAEPTWHFNRKQEPNSTNVQWTPRDKDSHLRPRLPVTTYVGWSLLRITLCIDIALINELLGAYILTTMNVERYDFDTHRNPHAVAFMISGAVGGAISTLLVFLIDVIYSRPEKRLRWPMVDPDSRDPIPTHLLGMYNGLQHLKPGGNATYTSPMLPMRGNPKDAKNMTEGGPITLTKLYVHAIMRIFIWSSAAVIAGASGTALWFAKDGSKTIRRSDDRIITGVYVQLVGVALTIVAPSLFQLLFLLLSSAETAYMRRKPRAAT